MKHVPKYARCLFTSVVIFIIPISVQSTPAEKLLPNDEEYLIGAEIMPAPIGGIEAIVKKINNMGLIRSGRVEGKVYLLAYINNNGDIEDVKVVKGIGGGCDEAAVEAVKKTKFSPGENGGKPVKVKMTLSIAFKSNAN